jgi:hypothetical protein
VDSERFDALTKVFGHGITRREVTTLAALAVAGVPTLEHVTAKKKKKPPAPPSVCRTVQQTCSGNCCTGLGCGDNGCELEDVCFQNEGGACTQGCDCRADLNCSERQGDTCRDCGFEQADCDDDNDCCLNSTTCDEVVGCDFDSNVCCLGLGEECVFHCDCCGLLGCAERGSNTETCQDCAFPQDECFGNVNNCCLLSSVCEENACNVENVCCQHVGEFCEDADGEPDDCNCCLSAGICGDNGCDDFPACCQEEGGKCFGEDCNCCADFFCNEQNQCEPFVPREGGVSRGRGDGAAQRKRTPKSVWSRQTSETPARGSKKRR